MNPRFVCTVRGKGSADVWPDFNRKKQPVWMMGDR
jgi:hypothetical protein